MGGGGTRDTASVRGWSRGAGTNTMAWPHGPRRAPRPSNAKSKRLGARAPRMPSVGVAPSGRRRGGPGGSAPGRRRAGSCGARRVAALAGARYAAGPCCAPPCPSSPRRCEAAGACSCSCTAHAASRAARASRRPTSCRRVASRCRTLGARHRAPQPRLRGAAQALGRGRGCRAFVRARGGARRRTVARRRRRRLPRPRSRRRRRSRRGRASAAATRRTASFPSAKASRCPTWARGCSCRTGRRRRRRRRGAQSPWLAASRERCWCRVCSLARYRECQRVIAETERLGYGEGRPSRRATAATDACSSTTRVARLRAACGPVWERVREHVPARLCVDWLAGGEDEELCGVWEARGLNNVVSFRFSKYFAGEGFRVHADEVCSCALAPRAAASSPSTSTSTTCSAAARPPPVLPTRALSLCFSIPIIILASRQEFCGLQDPRRP